MGTRAACVQTFKMAPDFLSIEKKNVCTHND